MNPRTSERAHAIGSFERRAFVACGLAFTLSWLGCSFDESANSARGCDDQCAVCHLDYCLMTLDDAISGAGTGGAGSTPTAGSSGDPGAGSGGAAGISGAGGASGAAGEAGGMPTVCETDALCFLGEQSARGVGACRDGIARCNGSEVEVCTGQVLPADESCNEVDDDCDGRTDEAVMLGSCDIEAPGACGVGRLVCESGAPICRARSEPEAETCNGEDDDCDGDTDEDTNVECYPSGEDGCDRSSSGEYECLGLCMPGTQVCEDGELSACTGFVTPADETCGGEEAEDENCDGNVDDGCPCEGDETQRCYTGPAFTAGIGRCRSGMQQCEGGVFGDCEGSIVPRAETCANQGADDNCNLLRDDVPGLGSFCTDTSRMGVCRNGTYACDGGELYCDTPAAQSTETVCDNADEDCDGDTDETFLLASDEENCGACNVACASGELCCGGACRDTNNNDAHCGGCNMPCGDGQRCCGGECKSLDDAETCGACNIACDADEGCCDRECKSLDDPGTCGSCDIECDGNQGCCDRECKSFDDPGTCGSCDIACGEDQDCCDRECKSLDDPGTCGSCDIACDSDQGCCDRECKSLDDPGTCGSCDIACGENQGCCNRSCEDLDNADFCGSCEIACGESQDCCDGTCEDIDTNDRCGSCTVECTDGCECLDGSCQTDAGVCL